MLHFYKIIEVINYRNCKRILTLVFGYYLQLSMEQSQRNSVNHSQPNNLEPAQHPVDIIAEFFHHYTLPECRGLLREILHQALSGYNTRDGIHPADLLRFLEELEKAAEAMYNIALNHPHPRWRGN